MTTDPFWNAILGILVVGVFLFAYWRFLEHGWKKDIAREREAEAEWNRTHPAE